MRRVRYHELGGPEVLRVEEMTETVPGPGEVLVRPEAIGVTLPVVRQLREGARLPASPGGEVVGRIEAIGGDVSGFHVGDRVAGVAFEGAYADLVPMSAAVTSAVPERIETGAAVAVVRSGQVALGALHSARISSGESVLVPAAAGGVGHLAVQLAKVLGAGRVVGLVGSREKARFVREFGADEALTYQDEWGEPFDVVLDGVGGEMVRRGIGALAPFGRLVSFSGVGGEVHTAELLGEAKTVTGFAMRPLATGYPELFEQRRSQLWRLLEDGGIRPVVREFPLHEVSQAHELVESRANRGKVVLRP
jgi:NADPH2:quinone reductase